MMKFKNQFTRRLSLNISPQTYAKIEKEAIKEGRKTGNFARRLLDRWAENNKANKQENKQEGNPIENVEFTTNGVKL